VVEVDAADVTPIRKSIGGREVRASAAQVIAPSWKPNSAPEVMS
jgi:hypothetical protein